jgi:gamma-butyrobetaine dioxygenase
MIDAPTLDSLRRSLAERGFARARVPGLLAQAERDPWSVARVLVCEPVVLVETHPISPIPEGRSFASNRAETPLHTDSQSHRGVPPYLQIMLCDQAATSGGETTLVDTWSLLEQIAVAEPELFESLLIRSRRIPFVFGDVVGPTLALRGEALVFTHSPMPARDEIGRRLAPWIAAAPRIELALETDEVLLVDNHRMLHGRHAFSDDRRRFVRLLVWSDVPARAPARLLHPARAMREQLSHATRDRSAELRERLLGPELMVPMIPIARRLELVLELLRGASPGMLARRHGVSEPELYRWRDAALRGAGDALALLDSPADHELALEQLLARLELLDLKNR